MENLLTQISEKLNKSDDILRKTLVDDNLIKVSFIDEEMKAYFDEKLYKIGDTYLYLFENISKRNNSTVVFELLKSILKLKSEYSDKNIEFFLVEKKEIINFETLLKSLPVSLEKYSPDFDYILSDFEESEDIQLKQTIKLKIFSEIIKYIYKDKELKGLMQLLIKNTEK